MRLAVCLLLFNAAAAAPEEATVRRDAREILQYGVPRTATTLQYMTLWAYVCALSMDANVIKAHNLQPQLNRARKGAAPLFITHQTKGAVNKFGVPAEFRPGAWRETARTLERQWKLPEGAHPGWKSNVHTSSRGTASRRRRGMSPEWR